MSPKNCTVTKLGLFIGLMFAWAAALGATAVGTVTDLSGPLLAKKTDGTVKVLSSKSAVEQGDLLVTEKDTYARIKFADNSEITLRPNTQFKIDNFSYAEDKPQSDSSVFSLIRGGLRAVTGALGKRSREKVSVNTPAATIGIRGTIYVAEYVPASDEAIAAYGMSSVAAIDASAFSGADRIVSDISPSGAALGFALKESSLLRLAQNEPAGGSGNRAPGLYVQVLDGMVHLTNSGGSQNFAAGQFGYTPSFQQPPVILPNNPGMQFTPPPAFNTSSAPGNAGTSANKSNNVDCEVR
jgi:hypothetical protein